MGMQMKCFKPSLQLQITPMIPLHMAWIFIPSFGVEYVGFLFFLTHTRFLNET
jgi:hypothetical protein